MTIHHYAAAEGIIGYVSGDVLHDETSDTWSIAVSDGRGVSLIPLAVVRRTGDTCVGDWRLTPLDVGFDLRAEGTPTVFPADESVASVGVEIDGQTYEVSGSRAVLVAVARAAGYVVIGGAP